MQRLRTDRGKVREESGRSFVGPLRRRGARFPGVVRRFLVSGLVVVVGVSARVLLTVAKEVSGGKGETVLTAVMVMGIVLGF